MQAENKVDEGRLLLTGDGRWCIEAAETMASLQAFGASWPDNGEVENGQYKRAEGEVARRNFGFGAGDKANASSWLLSRIPDGAEVFLDKKLIRKELNDFFGLMAVGPDRPVLEITESNPVVFSRSCDPRRNPIVSGRTSDGRKAGTTKTWPAGGGTFSVVFFPFEDTVGFPGLKFDWVRTDDIDENALSVGVRSVIAGLTMQSSSGDPGREEPEDSSASSSSLLPPGRSQLSEKVSHEAIGASLTFGMYGSVAELELEKSEPCFDINWRSSVGWNEKNKVNHNTTQLMTIICNRRSRRFTDQLNFNHLVQQVKQRGPVG